MLLLYPTCRRNIKRPQPDSHTTQKLGRVSQPLPAGISEANRPKRDMEFNICPINMQFLIMITTDYRFMCKMKDHLYQIWYLCYSFGISSAYKLL